MNIPIRLTAPTRREVKDEIIRRKQDASKKKHSASCAKAKAKRKKKK